MEVCEKQEIEWEHEHEVRVFPRNFEFFPNFHKCFYNSILGTRKKYFLFPLSNGLFKTQKDKCIEFNYIYSNINLNLYLPVKSNYKIQPVFNDQNSQN